MTPLVLGVDVAAFGVVVLRWLARRRLQVDRTAAWARALGAKGEASDLEALVAADLGALLGGGEALVPDVRIALRDQEIDRYRVALAEERLRTAPITWASRWARLVLPRRELVAACSGTAVVPGAQRRLERHERVEALLVVSGASARRLALARRTLHAPEEAAAIALIDDACCRLRR